MAAAVLRASYDVFLADAGDKALALMESHAFDLVLLDVRMPTRDGFDICETIRADARWQDIPIIFLSAEIDKDLIVRALAAGGVDYITKPFNGAELTSRVRTHVALKVARDDLKQLAEDKDELLGILAHDLKNHLGGMKVSAQVLASGLEKRGAPDLRALAENIHAGTDQMFAFVVEFLANSAADHFVTQNAEPIWMDEMSATATRHYQASAARKKIELLHSGKVTAPTVADPGTVNHILHNLISNAVKFSPAGETVHVSVETDHDGRAICRVQDAGPGFTAEDRQQLFRRYQRLSAQPTADEPSTGLGLSIVKKLVDHIGAEISCTNRATGGATFTLRFPASALETLDPAFGSSAGAMQPDRPRANAVRPASPQRPSSACANKTAGAFE